MGHISGEGEGAGLVYLRSFIYQFHVPLFFFLSGFCLKEQESWKEFLAKKIRRLYVPFVVCNSVFFLINIIAHALNGEQPVLINVLKHSVKILLGLSSTPLGGATWFLITLLQASILFKCLLSFSRRWPSFSGIISLILSVVAAITGMLIHLPYGLEKALVALLFVCVGYLSKSIISKNKLKGAHLSAIAFWGLLVTGFISFINRPDMAFHQYGNMFIYLFSSFVGILSVLAFCSLISRFPFFSCLKELGKRTIWILIGHFAAFKIVTIAQMIAFSLPFGTVFTHPCNLVDGFWPVLYFIAGFFIPILFCKAYMSVCFKKMFSHSFIIYDMNKSA